MTKEATACGRTNHSPQSKEQSSERLGDIGAYKRGGRPPLAGGRTGAVDSSSPTHKGSINQVTSSVRGSFGALPLRPTAMIRRTSCEVLLCASVYYAAGITAFDEWNCRADVACVGADLRVRPQNRLRSGEDRRTHRSAPTVGVSTPPSGSPEEKSTELPKREKLRISLAYEPRKQRITRIALIQQTPSRSILAEHPYSRLHVPAG